MKPEVEIEYCPGCRWLLRAGWTAQELLTTFEAELEAVRLRPSSIGRVLYRSGGRCFALGSCGGGSFPRDEGVEAIVA
jgi:selenoprotein W-related protein